jgi:RHS repeat-associated protein
VQERYVFYPYGQRLIFDSTWGARGSSSFNWLIGHQGLMHDPESGFINNRSRIMHPLLGRYLQRDLAKYTEIKNLYEYCNSNPSAAVDPDGELPAALAPLIALLGEAAVAALVAAAIAIGIIAIGAIIAYLLGRAIRSIRCSRGNKSCLAAATKQAEKCANEWIGNIGLSGWGKIGCILAHEIFLKARCEGALAACLQTTFGSFKQPVFDDNDCRSCQDCPPPADLNDIKPSPFIE